MGSKNQASGPKSIVKHISAAEPNLPRALKLPTMVNDELALYNEFAGELPVLDQEARMWLTVYHTVVWLGAATNIQPLEEVLTGNLAGHKVSMHHHVAAFDEQHEYAEDGDGDPVLWFFGPMHMAADRLEETATVDQATQFPTAALLPTAVDGEEQPLLARILANVKRELLDVDLYDQEKLLVDCRNSTAAMTEANGYHHRAREFALYALDTLEPLLLDEKDDLREISDLLDEGASREAISAAIGLTELLEAGDRFAALPDGAKLEIARISLVLEQLSAKNYTLVLARLEGRDPTDSIDGLAPVIEALTAKLPEADAASWQRLLNTAYASVAWYLLMQAQGAVEEVAEILGV